jgi:hypothetical protein
MQGVTGALCDSSGGLGLYGFGDYSILHRSLGVGARKQDVTWKKVINKMAGTF